MSKKYTKGEVIEVKIEKIVPRGFGIGFAEGLTVLVPLSAPGDVVLVKIRDLKKNTAFADIVEIKHRGLKRITPPCQYYGVCGGCDFQHLDYPTQLEAKVGIIRDCLTRIGKINFEGEINIIESPNQFEYRSRARWHIDVKNKQIGYFKRDSNTIVDIAECPILTPGMQSTLEHLRNDMAWERFWEDSAEIEAVSGEGGRVSTHSMALSDPAAEIDIEIGGETYSYTAATFFQANRSLTGKLIETAIGDATGDNALDLYAGVGLFSLPMARRFRTVTGVEGNSVAIALAEKNAFRAKLTNLEFANKGVEGFLYNNRKKKSDFVLLDPPRSGTEKETIPMLAAMKTPNVSYVSCEPSILARDLRILLDAGYAIESITALDLFPQTHHVETVVHLKI